MVNNQEQRTWSTAISKDGDRAIVFRYVSSFGPNNPKVVQPDRIILAWRFVSENGLPSTEECEQMDELEDGLSSLIEMEGFTTLALVSTGENLREWVFYAKSEDEFIERLNVVLSGAPIFPIEIHTGRDPDWSTYESFKSRVKS